MNNFLGNDFLSNNFLWNNFLWNNFLGNNFCYSPIFCDLVVFNLSLAKSRYSNLMIGIWNGLKQANKKANRTEGLQLIDLAHTPIGLYRTSRPVRKSDKFSKSGLSGNQTFSFLDTGLLTILKIEKKSKSKKKIQKKISRFFFVYLSGLGTFDTKFVSRDLILWKLITCTW